MTMNLLRAFTQFARFTFELSIDQEATMNRLGCMYEQESVQMKRAVVDTLLTQADLLSRRHMY